MPVLTLVAMPAGVIALTVMPLGLERWPLLVMGGEQSYRVSLPDRPDAIALSADGGEARKVHRAPAGRLKKARAQARRQTGSR